jgi:hypothetical protein
VTVVVLCQYGRSGTFSDRLALRLDYAGQLAAEIMLVRLRHMPILRQRNLSEGQSTQTIEWAATSIRAPTLTDAKYSIANSVTITRAPAILPQLVAQLPRRLSVAYCRAILLAWRTPTTSLSL